MVSVNRLPKSRKFGLRSALMLATGLSGMLIAADSAFAQSASVGSDTIESVTVTVRKVAEDAQTVPLEVTSLNARDLEASGATTLTNALQQVAGITFNGSGTEANQVPTIRGQYDFNFSGLTDGTPNVAVFLDGVYLQNPDAISVGFLSLERIEVVEGPVSALYGRNAFGGAINYVSKIPTDTFQANVVARAGQFATDQVTADVSGAIIPGVLRVGLAYNWQNSNGPFKDNVTGVKAGQVNKKDYKVSVDFTPLPKLDINAGYYVGNDHFGQDPIVISTPNCANNDTVCGPIVANPIQLGVFPPQAGDSGNSRNVQAGHLKINYDLDFADLSYLGGYNRAATRYFEDFSGLRNGLAFNYTVPPGGTFGVQELFGGDDSTEDNSHELRLTSKQDQPFRWALGANYYGSTLVETTLIGLNGSQIPAGQSVSGPANPGNFGLAALFVTPFGQASTTNYTKGVIHDVSFSGFVSAEYDVLPDLTIGGEFRQTGDKQNLDIQRNAFITNTFRPYGTFPSTGFNYGNYRAFARYKFDEATMFYVSVASGTKNGGYNIQANVAANQSYQPETNNTYEGGVKTNFYGDRLQFNADIFHIDTKGLQTYAPQGNGVNTVIQNIGGTINTGFEASVIAKPLPGLTVDGSYIYTDPRYINGSFDTTTAADCALVPSCAGRIFQVPSGAGPRNAINLTGLKEPFSSTQSFHLGMDYRRAVTDDITGFFHIDYRFNSKQYTQLNYGDLSYTPASNMVNLRFGGDWRNYTLALDISNVTNDQTPINPTQATELNNFGHEDLSDLPLPRIVSVELAAHF